MHPPLHTGAAPDLLPAVERELGLRRWHLGFAPAVEARFEADHGAARRRELIVAGLVSLVVFNLFLLNDWHVRPEVFEIAVGWRLGVLTSYGALVLVLVERGVPARWREALMGSTVFVAALAACAIFRGTTSAFGIYDPFVFSLIFMAGNIAFPLRFVPALVSTALGVVMVAAFVLTAPRMPAGAGTFAVGLLVGVAVFTLLACWRIEALARRSYLLVLRESLRAEAAQQSAAAFAVLSNTDALTRLPNRRRFETVLADAWASAESSGHPLALLMVDIDNFKRFNDRFGHPAGDACLQRVAAALQEELRGADFVARLGGEEFVVLLTHSSAGRASTVAERLRRCVEALAIPHDGVGGQAVVTISLGLAVGAAADPAGLLAAADTALYEAKRAGRNRFACADAAVAAVAA